MNAFIGWTLAVLSIVFAIPAQALGYLAEWIGDHADDWIE